MEEGYFRQVSEFTHQIREAAKQAKDIILKGEVNHLVIAGMGNSISAGMILQNYLELPVHISLDTTYTAPNTVNKKTLFFALSYSGNTEETLSSLRDAVRKEVQAIVITSGGKIGHFAQSEKLPVIKIPQMNPRNTLAYFLMPMLNVLQTNQLIPNQEKYVSDAAVAAAHPLLDERAGQLAKKLVGKTPLIYASHKLKSLAYWWKIRFNDNSKILAFYDTLPETMHSEVAGFEHAEGNYYALFFYDQEDSVRMKQLVQTMKSFLADKGIPTTLIALSGHSFLDRILSATHLGTLTSIYLAEENGIDPESNTVIDEFKKRTLPSF